MIKRLLPEYNYFERHFVKNGVNLIYFTSPDPNALYLENLNFIFTVWDVAHKKIPYFPELRQNFSFETREELYSGVLSKAVAIIVGHDFARDDLIKYYQLEKNKIFKIPFKPSPKLIEYNENPPQQLSRIFFEDFPNEYIYYPAQYIAHKNHYLILKAFEKLKNKGSCDLGLILTGADKGNLKFLKTMVKEYNIENLVRFLPFQTDENVYSIFKGASALIMPSYIGPATLPTMEAFHLNIPLLMPNSKENLAFYKDACIFYEAYDADDLAKQIMTVKFLGKNRLALLEKAEARYQEILKSNELNELFEYLVRIEIILKSYNQSMGKY